MKVELACLNFLAQHNFDFSKCFNEGLDFRRLRNMKEYQQALNQVSSESDLWTFLQSMSPNLEMEMYRKPIRKGEKFFEKKKYPHSRLLEDEEAICEKYR